MKNELRQCVKADEKVEYHTRPRIATGHASAASPISSLRNVNPM